MGDAYDARVPPARTPGAVPSFSKSQYAYDEVKSRIFSGELPEGGVISQERLAGDLGVSTTPVREALKRLAAEGLVSLATHSDARVTDLSPAEARGLVEVRLELDPLAVRLAASRRTEADVRHMRSALAALEPLTGDAGVDGLYAHRAFHRSVYAASGNDTLVQLLDGLWDKADRYRMLVLRERARSAVDIERVRTEHAAIVQHVEAGEPDAAAAVMRAHIHGSLGRRVGDPVTSPPS